jgi:hypothetical protein
MSSTSGENIATVGQIALADIDINFFYPNGAPIENLPDFTIKKVILSESLKTPGLQTMIEIDSYKHNYPAKDLEGFKNAVVDIQIDRPILESYGIKSKMNVTQRVYRLQNRANINVQTENLILRACDDTLLNDASSLVSKSWKCTSPSEVVAHVLRTCVGANSIDVESSGPARDYIAENIHPFQVISQQANVALAGGDDPSFIHYMTYQNYGTHHFRSLKSLTQQKSLITYIESETGITHGYADPHTLMSHSFPCDFDLLSDILNGIGRDGKEINSLVVFNPVTKLFSLVGDQTVGCGIGQGVIKYAQTNYGTAQQQNACNFEVEKYLLKRQARMNLLEQDKIALKCTVPFNPELNVGKVISLLLPNKTAAAESIFYNNYGSGDYLIMNLFHEIKNGGHAVTTMDCVSTTVKTGVV